MYEFAFSYQKNKVIQALRRHFLSRKEIRLMIILVNVFAITSAVLYFMHKIRPEPFLLGSFVWVLLIIGIFFILPFTIYRKEKTFGDSFRLQLSDEGLRLENERGYVNWKWSAIQTYFETETFFHLYFSAKSFFLVPKDGMTDAFKDELRKGLRANARQVRF